MKKGILLVSVLILGLVFGSLSAYAYLIVYPGFTPIPAYVACHPFFSSEMLTAVHNACLTWNGGGQGNLVYRKTALHNTTQYPYYNQKNEITKHYQGTNAYLMQMTAVSLAYNVLSEVDIDINISKEFGSSSSCFDTQTAITHEIGHLLGLGDVRTSRSNVMYFQRGKGEWCRELSADDKAGLAEIYGGETYEI